MPKKSQKSSAYDSKGKWKKIILEIFISWKTLKKETDDVEEVSC